MPWMRTSRISMSPPTASCRSFLTWLALAGGGARCPLRAREPHLWVERREHLRQRHLGLPIDQLLLDRVEHVRAAVILKQLGRRAFPQPPVQVLVDVGDAVVGQPNADRRRVAVGTFSGGGLVVVSRFEGLQLDRLRQLADLLPWCVPHNAGSVLADRLAER